MKMLVNNPFGGQEIIEILEGGDYFDKGLVIWDERIDGPMPDVQVGGMVRDEQGLHFDKELFEQNEKSTKNVDEKNEPILRELASIDKKSIRAIREGDTTRIAMWNKKAEELRAKLFK